MINQELNALIKLMDDPNSEVFEAIKLKLCSIGCDAIPQLEKTWETATDELFQVRIENVIHDIQQTDIKQQFTTWSKNKADDLLTGAYLVAKSQYPNIEKQAIIDSIDSIKKDAWLEINNNLTALEKIKILNHIVFEIHGFSRSDSFIYSDQVNFINNLITSKKGSPIALAILYAIIAQQLQMPVYGVNLPKNFILCYKDSINDQSDFEHNILFYINPFNKGIVFGTKEIDLFLKQQKIKSETSYYKACSNKIFIEQLIKNLIEINLKNNQKTKAKEYKELLKILYF